MSEIDRLLNIMAQLRDPNTGCPWDVEQNFSSIVPYTIEEAYEVAEAIADNDMPSLKEELGDLLLQVVFHAQMAKEENIFTFEDVAKSISDKMIARHPHVFGDKDIASAKAQEQAWEEMKAKERAAKGQTESSAMDGISKGVTALQRAVKLTKRAAKQGFDWEKADDIFNKLDEETDELQEAMQLKETHERLIEEFGDMLFVMTNLARHLKIDPEQALTNANHKFETRYRQMETLAKQRNTTLPDHSLDELDALWEEAKKQLK